MVFKKRKLKRIWRSFLVVVLLLMTLPIAVYASDANYIGTIRITDNGTTAVDVFVPFYLDTSSLIAGGYVTSSLNNTNIQTHAGADIAYMPAISDNTLWSVYVPSILASSSLDYPLYIGGTTDMEGKIRYFPGAAGMNVTDSAGIELGDNFTFSFAGFIDTDNGTNKNLVEKGKDFRVFVSGTTSGNITAAIGFGDDFTTDEWTDVGTGIHITIADERLDYDSIRGTGDNRTYYDLTSISDTEWRLDYTFHPTSHPVDDGNIFAFGLWSSLGNFDGYANDAIIVILKDAPNNVSLRQWDGGAFTGSAGIPIVHGTTYYTTLARESSTNCTLSLYSDVGRVTHIAGSPVSLLVPATVTTLRYFQASNFAGIGLTGQEIGWIDDVQLDYESVSLGDVSTGEHTIEVSTDNNSLLFGIGVDNSYPGFPITDNLTRNFPLFHPDMTGTTLTSKDANARTSTVIGAAYSSSAGRVFNGTTDYIDAGNADNLANWTSDMALEAWVRYDITTVGDQMPLSAWTGKTDNTVPYDIWGIGSHFDFRMGEGASQAIARYALTPVLGTWYHIVGTIEGTTLRIYVNGVLGESTDTFVGTRQTGTKLTIGAGNNAGFRPWEGSIGEWRFYKQALDQTEVTTLYNATKWKYEGADEQFYYNLLPADGVPDNSANLTFFQNDAMPYVETANVTINGTAQGSWVWSNNSTFADLSGNGNTATPSFRTISNYPQVSASLVSFSAITLAQASAWSVGDYGSMIVGTPDEPAGMYTELVTAHIPGNQFVVDVLGASSTPVEVFWFTIPFVLAIVVGTMVFKASRSLFAKWGIMMLVLVGFALMGPLPTWPAFLMAFNGIGLMVISKNAGW